ncbi:MAG: MFS transporter [Deltaproteobacteria bacterium]|nr:MFS transporter [Deltaproteobacteria bacterium]
MFHGWWIVSTVFMVQLVMVGFSSYGLPLLLVPVEEEFDCGMKKLSDAMIGMTALGMVLPLLVGPLVDRWSARGLMLIGTCSLVGGLLGMAWAPNELAFGIAISTLVAAAMTLLGPIVCSAVVSRWFTASRGRALGLAAMGTSVGGMLMAPLFGLGFESIGWRDTVRLMALMIAVGVLPLLLFVLRNHPRDMGLEPEGVPAAAPSPGMGVVPTMVTGDVLRRPAFWMVSICLALFLGAYSGMLFSVPKFAADLGADSMARSQVTVALTVSGLIGKLAFGWAADRFSLKLGLWAAIGLTIGSVLLMTTEPEFPVLLGSVAVMGLAAGGILPVWGALMAAIFGVANFGRAMGLQAPLISVGAMGGYGIAGRVHGATGSFVLAFEIFAVALGLAFLVLFALRVPTAAAHGLGAAEPEAVSA